MAYYTEEHSQNMLTKTNTPTSTIHQVDKIAEILSTYKTIKKQVESIYLERKRTILFRFVLFFLFMSIPLFIFLITIIDKYLTWGDYSNNRFLHFFEPVLQYIVNISDLGLGLELIFFMLILCPAIGMGIYWLFAKCFIIRYEARYTELISTLIEFHKMSQNIQNKDVSQNIYLHEEAQRISKNVGKIYRLHESLIKYAPKLRKILEHREYKRFQSTVQRSIGLMHDEIVVLRKNLADIAERSIQTLENMKNHLKTLEERESWRIIDIRLSRQIEQFKTLKDNLDTPKKVDL